jgi:predicted ATPase
MTERTAAFEEQVSRVREQAEQQLAALQGRCRELEVRTEAAEAVSVALETRHREICREAERLVALLGPQGAVVVEQLPTLLAAADDPTQAVA